MGTAEPAAGGARPPARAATAKRPRWRRILAPVLVVVAAVLLFFGLFALFAARIALTDTFVAPTTAEMLRDPTVRQDVSQYIATQIFESRDVDARIEAALPPRAKPLAKPITEGLQVVAINVTNRVLGNPRVIDLVENAAKVANAKLLAIVEGKKSGRIQAQDGDVVLNLRPVVVQVAQRIGVTPPAGADSGQLVILKDTQLESAQTFLHALRIISLWIGPLAVLLFAAAVWVAAGRRRRILLWIGVSILVVGLALRLVRRAAGTYLVNRLTDDAQQYRDGWQNAYNILTKYLAAATVTLIIIGIVLVLGALLAGPGRREVAVRRFVAPALRNRWIAYGIVVLLVLVVLAVRPGIAPRQWLSALLILVLGLIGAELLHRQVLAEFPSDAPAGPGGPPAAV
jgi:ABC-type glycerol-3-phosphate transport system permease component